jgi:phage/plasmid-like protein (TIGR03299 family)
MPGRSRYTMEAPMTTVTIGGEPRPREPALQRWIGADERTMFPTYQGTPTLEELGLDWHVKQAPIGMVGRCLDDGDLAHPAPPEWCLTSDPIHGVYANYRDDTDAVLSVTSTRWAPAQNEDFYDLFRELCTIGDGATFKGGGEFDGGKRVWFAAQLNRDLTIAGEPVFPLFLGQNGHDGGRSLQAMPIPLRPYCTNQTPMIRGRAKAQGLHVYARHTRAAIEKGLQHLRRVISHLAAQLDDFEAEANQLALTTITEREADRIIHLLWPLEPHPLRVSELAADGMTPAQLSERQRLNRERAQIAIRHALQQDYNSNIRGTAWGLWQAIIEARDWSGRAPRDHSPFRHAIDGSRSKRDALDVILDITQPRNQPRILVGRELKPWPGEKLEVTA